MSRVSALRALWAVVVWTLVLGGCSAQKSLGDLWGDWTGSSSSGATARGPAAFWTAVDGLELHAEPSFSSDVVAVLPLHQKVYRDAVDRGFARVVTDGSRKKGWVDNAKLTWKAPKGSSRPGEGGESTAAPAAPGSPAAPASAATGVPEAASAPGTPPNDGNAPADTATPPHAAGDAAGSAQPAGSDAPPVNPTVFDPF